MLSYSVLYVGWNNKVRKRRFGNVKNMAQWVRRNSLPEGSFQYFYGDEPICYFGNTMVRLSELKAAVAVLEPWLSVPVWDTDNQSRFFPG